MHPNRLQDLYLICMSWVYLWAFASLYHQIPGLYGDNGLLPVETKLKCDADSMFECAFTGDQPSILHVFVHWLNLSASQALELAAFSGIILAAISVVFKNMRSCPLYFALWYLYFSCFQVGQTFLWFQWDTLLIECGFLTVLVAPMKLFRFGSCVSLPQDNVTLFLVKWLAFRLMFASGIVKLTSECPTWWGLTALHYHFESQCIPMPLAWFAHHSPDWIKKLSVVATYVIEILIPPLFLAPVRHLRVFAFWSQILLMAGIMVTGNYNFFNLVYSFVCLPLLIGSSYSQLNSEKLKRKMGAFYSVAKAILIGFGYGAVIYWTIKLFDLKIASSNTTGVEISSRTAFNKNDLYGALTWSVPWLIVVGTLCFVSEILTAIVRCFLDYKSNYAKVWAFMQCVPVCILCTLMFCISLVPFSHLDRGAHSMIWPEIHNWHRISDKFQLTHSYGLFRSMTGVGGRPEVIVSGSNSMEGPWHEYEFLYKIGSLERRPPIIIPHQPRLDWQMWFAALGSYQHNPWFISLVHKLLNNEKDVLDLIEHNPFPKSPPTYIRSQLFLYHFTPPHQNNSRWWVREFKDEYMPPIDAKNPSVLNFLTENGLIVKKKKAKRSTLIGQNLANIRTLANSLGSPEFVWSISGAVLLGFDRQNLLLLVVSFPINCCFFIISVVISVNNKSTKRKPNLRPEQMAQAGWK